MKTEAIRQSIVNTLRIDIETASAAADELFAIGTEIAALRRLVESEGDRICIMRDILAKRAEKPEHNQETTT